MKCARVMLNGTPTIVCGTNRIRGCCVCCAPAGRLCDWKIGKDTTCDKPICDEHAHQPAVGKDLCQDHAAAWQSHPGNQKASQCAKQQNEGHIVSALPHR